MFIGLAYGFSYSLLVRNCNYLLFPDKPILLVKFLAVLFFRLTDNCSYFSVELIILDLIKIMSCVHMWVFKAASAAKCFAHTSLYLSDTTPSDDLSLCLGLFSCGLSSPHPFCLDTGWSYFNCSLWRAAWTERLGTYNRGHIWAVVRSIIQFVLQVVVIELQEIFHYETAHSTFVNLKNISL